MKTRSLEIGVGLFILGGLLAVLLLALHVSGLNLTGAAGTYRVYAFFDNAAGITPRAKVTMAGVTIGKVVDVQLDHETFMGRAVLELDEEVDYLPVDSTASVLTAGLLGEKYIGITVGGEEEVLEEGSVIRDTQSALVLEDLIGKFLLNSVNKPKATDE